MWVKFTEDWDWYFRPRASRFYQSGRTYNVTRECADQAISAGVAVKTEKQEEKDKENGG